MTLIEWGLIVAVLAIVILIVLAVRLSAQQKQHLQEQVDQAEQHQQALTAMQSEYHQLGLEHAALKSQLESFAALKQEVVELRQQALSHASLQSQLDEKSLQLEKAERHATALQAQLSELQQVYSELKSTSAAEQASAEEKINLLQEAKQQLSNEFKALAHEIFEQKQQQFTEQSQSSMSALLQPLHTSVEQFKQRLETTHKEDLEGRASLQEQLKSLHQLNSQMTQEAQNLTLALKGDSKTQGNWGELILQRLLEKSGLREGEEFVREKSFTTEQGRLRPDVIVNLPGAKHIVIDSKVSLTHYEQALSVHSEAEKKAALKAHLTSIKQHIQTLADKRYDHLQGLNSVDFTLMFMPIEGAYLMAIEADSSVFENAFAKQIAVVTPTTLFTTLKTVEQLWRYERQSENTQKLIERAAEVHDKFVGFVTNFEKVGAQLNQAQNTYDKAFGQLATGRGNLVNQAVMLKELAGRTKKELPEHLVETATQASLEERENTM